MQKLSSIINVTCTVALEFSLLTSVSPYTAMVHHQYWLTAACLVVRFSGFQVWDVSNCHPTNPTNVAACKGANQWGVIIECFDTTTLALVSTSDSSVDVWTHKIV